MKELILEYLQEGIEVNFRFESPFIKLVMVRHIGLFKTQNSKVFSIDQFADEFMVENTLERCRAELEEIKPDKTKWICVYCTQGGCEFGKCIMKADK